MQESYPESILKRLNLKYQFTEDRLNKLREVFLVPGLKEIFELKLLDSEKLFKQMGTDASRSFILITLEDVRRVISIYQVIKDSEVFVKGKLKLDDFLYWLPMGSSFHLFIPSIITAKYLVDVPNDLSSLQTLADKSSNVLCEWDNIRISIDRLNDMPLRPIANRKSLALNINSRLLPLIDMISSCTPLLKEYAAISKRLLEAMNESHVYIEKVARKHFEEYFLQQKKLITTISTFGKKTGDQIGCGVTIKFKDKQDAPEQEIRYYVKTHQHGSTSRSGSTKPVDPKELFVYKLLEYMGLGPKSHFFFNPLSEGGFYIATQDVGYTKVPGKTKLFETYENLKTGFYNQHNSGSFNDAEVIKSLSCADILSRILVLYDVTTNASNFGRVMIDQKRSKWKILDFRHDTRASYILPGIFEGFISGNGMYNYGEFLGHALRDRSEPERLDTALQVIRELETGRPCHNSPGKKMSFSQAVNRAFAEIVNYVKKNNSLLKSDLRAILGELVDVSDVNLLPQLNSLPLNRIGDFGRYITNIQENFANIARGIKARRQDIPLSNPNI